MPVDEQPEETAGRAPAPVGPRREAVAIARRFYRADDLRRIGFLPVRGRSDHFTLLLEVK